VSVPCATFSLDDGDDTGRSRWKRRTSEQSFGLVVEPVVGAAGASRDFEGGHGVDVLE